MSGPRIVESESGAPRFAGDVPSDLVGLPRYTRDDPTIDSKAVGTAPRSRSIDVATPRARLIVTALMVLVTVIVVTSVWALRDTIIGENSHAGEETEPRINLAVSGVTGPDRIRCIGDVITVTLNGVGADGGVIVAWLDAPNGSLQFLLRQSGSDYQGHVYTWAGTIATDLAPAKMTIWPGERVVLRVNGVIHARELFVVGTGARLGSRGDETCA